MKIAITGKGGTGKTTIAAILGYLFSEDDKKIFFIDCDPDRNLATTIGFNDEELKQIKPIVELKDIIAERTELNNYGMFKLNPKVDDIPDNFSISKNNMKYLFIGTIKKGGSGCYCPENAFLRALLNHLLIQRDEIIILDMPAGIEHLTRGTVKSINFLIIICEPTIRSVQTSQQIEELAKDIGLTKIHLIGNKIVQEGDIDFLISLLSQEKFLGFVQYDKNLVQFEQKQKPLYEISNKILSDVRKIKEKLDGLYTLSDE